MISIVSLMSTPLSQCGFGFIAILFHLTKTLMLIRDRERTGKFSISPRGMWSASIVARFRLAVPFSLMFIWI